MQGMCNLKILTLPLKQAMQFRLSLTLPNKTADQRSQTSNATMYNNSCEEITFAETVFLSSIAGNSQLIPATTAAAAKLLPKMTITKRPNRHHA